MISPLLSMAVAVFAYLNSAETTECHGTIVSHVDDAFFSRKKKSLNTRKLFYLS
jgi:hypothetical protein